MQTFIYVGLLLFWALTLAAFFMIGFLVNGSKPRTGLKSAKQSPEEAELERLRREYSNFLSYDGSEQEEINS